MSANFKKILFIIALLLIAAFVAFGLYYMFLKTSGQLGKLGISPTSTLGKLPLIGKRTTSTITGTGVTTTGYLPTTSFVTTTPTYSYYQPKTVTQISSDYATYPSLNQNGTLRYHNVLDGKFYRVTTDGQIKALNDETFYNVKNVTWAKTKDKAVIEYPDSSKIIYNFETNKQVSLPKHWEEFSFSPDSSEIAAKSMGLSPENRFLITTKDDGTGTKIIEPMGNYAQEVSIDWSPSRQVLAFSQTGQALGADRREILLVGLNGENFKSLKVEGSGFTPQWSSTGKKLLYSVYSGRTNYKPELWIVDSYGDSIGSNRQTVNINTWADKCAFGDDTTIYCAVPKSMPDGAGISRAITNSTYDDMYKIDLSTGLRTPISLDASYNVNNISYDTKKNKLFFTDLNKNGVFEIKL